MIGHKNFGSAILPFGQAAGRRDLSLLLRRLFLFVWGKRAVAKSFAFIALFLLFSVPGLSGCGGEPTLEQQIIAVIEEMELRAEAGERRAFIKHVDPEFMGQGGTMTRDDMRAFFVVQLNRYHHIQARLLPIAVRDLGGGQAAAQFRALVTGGRPGMLPESGQLLQVSSTWIDRDGDWLLLTADWEPVQP